MATHPEGEFPKKRTVQLVLDIDVDAWYEDTPDSLAHQIALHLEDLPHVKLVIPMKAVWVV